MAAASCAGWCATASGHVKAEGWPLRRLYPYAYIPSIRMNGLKRFTLDLGQPRADLDI
jgi:hypothetical protein